MLTPQIFNIAQKISVSNGLTLDKGCVHDPHTTISNEEKKQY